MKNYLLQGMYRPLKVMLTDRYSGAKRDITVAEPAEVPAGWYWYGQKAKRGHHDKTTDRYLLVRPHPDNFTDEPLAQAIEFEYQWGMSGHKMNNAATFGLWRAKPPAGYEVLSDIFNRNSKPKIPNYVCISKKCLIPTSYSSIWDDKGSGASHDGSMWEIGDDGEWKLFRANGGYKTPTLPAWRLNIPWIEIVKG